MSLCRARRMRSPWIRLCCVAVLTALASSPWCSVVRAEAPTQIVRVEEDWELVVGTPDVGSVSPQVSCALSPVGHVDSVYATLELNHQSLPSFVPGGLQLQVWNGESPLGSRKFPNSNVLGNSGETVRWTQSMRLDSELLTFEITDGSSSTWGNFGGQGYLKASLVTTLTDLNQYDPAVSVKNTGVGYAANRVTSLTLKRVRLFTSTGEVLEDDTPRPVNNHQ